MSNIKQLKGLKVEAIAVDASLDYEWKMWGDGKCLSGLEKSIGSMSRKEYIDLPEGDWTILGRANELDFIDIGGIEDIGLPWTECKKYWLSYMAANGLSNELILIPKI